MSQSRILHVDDDADIRFLVELTLDQSPDLELRSYASGGEALAAAREDPPDLALVDVMMPGMDGISLAAAFRETPGLAAVPIIFVTAKAYPDEVARLRENGAADVIVKPFDLAALEASVRRILARPDGGGAGESR
ncbi:MAG: response regulator [Nitriliruptor sp.]|uniref:response regulator n=1 Tax=Nitriliruptor sp. TaxID=2448056 RepID=UPI0034A08DB3